MSFQINLDFHSHFCFPRDAYQGEAQHRFAFRPEGVEEEIWLQARLARIQGSRSRPRSGYRVVLWPEGAERERIFSASAKCKIDAESYQGSWMLPEQTQNYRWDAFEENFNNPETTNDLERHWTVFQNEKRYLLEVGAGGRGQIVAVLNPAKIGGFSRGGERFKWWRNSLRRQIHNDWDFLQTSTADFRRRMRLIWNDETSDMRYAVNWRDVPEEKRDELAFACDEGSWKQLRRVAQWVLTVRMGREEMPFRSKCKWDFTSYGFTPVRLQNDAKGDFSIWDDNFLRQWRCALVDVFRPVNVRTYGVAEGIPRCLDDQIGHSELNFIRISAPSQRQIMVAQLHLLQWAWTHFSNEEAQRLLAL